APWLLAAEDRGVSVRHANIDVESCTVDMDDFAAKLSDRTRIAAFNWASNGAGTISDVEAMTRLAREAGAISYVDAVQFAPHGPRADAGGPADPGAGHDRRRDPVRHPRHRPARADRCVHGRRPDAGRGVGRTGTRRHLHLGRQLLRTGANGAAGTRGAGRRR